jgi:hypothetical protein
MNSTSDLEVGWRRGKQGGIYSPVDEGGGAAHRERRQHGGGSPAGHEVVNNIAKMRSPARLSGGKKEKEGTRFARQRGVRATHRREKKREGEWPGTGTRAKIESRQACRGKRGVQCNGEASAAPCHGHASTTHVGPIPDGVRRTRSDSDPTSVARLLGTGAMSNRVFQILQTTSG